MKNILVILIFIFGLKTYSQTPILFLENRKIYETIDGAYYKDLQNVLNDFEGEWLYTNGTTLLRIVLVKKEAQYRTDGGYYEDLMVGEYQYIENGVEKINTLADLSQNLGRGHKIKGNHILNACYFMTQGDCIEGEKRLNLSFIDAVTPHFATMILKRRVINGQEAIKALIVFNYAGDLRDTGGIVPDPTLPWQQEYVMFKQ